MKLNQREREYTEWFTKKHQFYRKKKTRKKHWITLNFGPSAWWQPCFFLEIVAALKRAFELAGARATALGVRVGVLKPSELYSPDQIPVKGKLTVAQSQAFEDWSFDPVPQLLTKARCITTVVHHHFLCITTAVPDGRCCVTASLPGAG